MPPAPPKNQTWQGNKNGQGVIYDKPGRYLWPAGGMSSWNAQQSAQVGNYGCSIQVSGVTASGQTVNGGFRGASIRDPNGRPISNIVLDHFVSRNAGVAGSSHGTGGQGIYTDHVTGLTIQDCSVRNPAGHGCYVAETARAVRLLRLDFSSVNEHSQLLQFNSEDGQGIFDAEVHDSSFHVTDQSTDVVNVLGVGLANQPLLFVNCKLLGGRRSLAIAGAQGRQSVVVLQNCTVTRPAFVDAGCTLILKGNTRLPGHTGGGHVVQG